MNNKRLQNDYLGRQVAEVGLIAALYVVISMITAPLSFGLNLRISEGLNMLALYNRRYIYGITLGVFIANYFAYGALDMVVGSLSTFVFLLIGQWVAHWVVQKCSKSFQQSNKATLLKYLILNILFSLSMFTIAIMVVFLDASEAFWPLYIYLAGIEFLSQLVGGVFIYLLSKRIDLTR